jgi:hypothetical protein
LVILIGSSHMRAVVASFSGQNVTTNSSVSHAKMQSISFGTGVPAVRCAWRLSTLEV